MNKAGKKEGNTNAVAAFHHVVAKGDLEKVKDFVLGGERKPGHQRIPVNSQDEDGLAAVHWAAMRGKRKQLCDVINYLVQTVQGAQELASKGDGLLHKSALELAHDAALASDEGVLSAVKGSWDMNKTYGHANKEGQN